MRRHLLGVSLLVPVLLCSCASDRDGTYSAVGPQQLEVYADGAKAERAAYVVMQQLAAKETRPDGSQTIPSMRQSSATTTAIDDGVTLVGERQLMSFAGTDGTVYEVERLLIPKRSTRVTLRTSAGSESDPRAAEFFRLMKEALADEGLSEMAPAAK